MKIRQIELTDSQRTELEESYRQGKTAGFRQRCHIIILKSQSRKAKDISQITGLNIQSIYNWLNRYEEHGIQGLQTKAGQGRPKILALTNNMNKSSKTASHKNVNAYLWLWTKSNTKQANNLAK